MIGGKELNLHVLYVEVTKRGGFDKVPSLIFLSSNDSFMYSLSLCICL